MCGLLRANGFPWTSPVGHILVLVPRFDREQHSRDTARLAAKMSPELK